MSESVPDLLYYPPAQSRGEYPQSSSSDVAGREQPDSPVAVTARYVPLPSDQELPSPPEYAQYRPGVVLAQSNEFVPIHQPDVPEPVANVLEERSQLPRGTLCLLLYWIATFLFVILTIVVCWFSTWVSWCGMNVTLSSCDSLQFDTFVSKVCYHVPSHLRSCGDVCSTAEKLQNAGTAMKACGIISLIFQIPSVALCFPIAFKSGMACTRCVVRLAMLLGAASWVIGTLTYCGFYIDAGKETLDLHIASGFVITIAITLPIAITSCVGNVTLKKLQR